MTLNLLLNNLCELAIKNNLVNYAAAGGSIYNLNGETIKDYPFIFISPTDEIEVGENTTTYGLTIFYCDRLLESKDNDTQIYSIATDTISNFLRQVASLDGVVDVADYTIRVFSETQKMNDSLNGAYARVRINVLNTAACAQWFDETGAPIGTYIPSTIKDVSVLENLASKAWVKQYVGDVGGDGISEEEANELIRKALLAYTKTDKFATINGSGITNNEVYELLETSEFREFLSGYTQEILEIRSEISAATPSDYDELKEQVSANTQDIEAIKQSVSALTPIGYEEIKEQVSANTENIETLSSRTSENATAIEGIGTQVSANTENIATLSAFTSGLSFTINEHTEKIEHLETAVSGIVETIATQSSAITGINEVVTSQGTEISGISENLSVLSAQTSGNTAQIADLSGSTEQAVSSLTQMIELLSGATYSGLSSITYDITELSSVTENLEAQIASLDDSSNVAFFDLQGIGSGATAEQQLYQDMLDAYGSGKTIVLVGWYEGGLFGKGFSLPILYGLYPNMYFGFRPMAYTNAFSSVTREFGELQFSDEVYVKPEGVSGSVVRGVDGLLYFTSDYTRALYASNTKYGFVRLGDGVSSGSSGVVNVNVGSGLTIDGNNAVSIDNSVVTSQSVIKIWSGSLAAYQSLGTYSNDTLYLII